MRKIEISNGWNTPVFQILRKKHDDEFIFKGNLLSRLPKSVELSHNWILINFKYQGPEFYARLFYELGKGPFEFIPVRTKVHEIRKLVHSAPKLYVFQENNSASVLC